MTIRIMIQKLVEEYAAIVRTEHHIQIPTPSGMHDVWIGKDGLKWKLHGNRKVDEGTPERLLTAIGNHIPAQTDLAWMQRLTAFLKRIEYKVGVFVDAGFKDGVAQIALVRSISPGCADIVTRRVKAENSTEAEHQAVKMAQAQWPEDVVFTDNQGAAMATGATWIPRESNKVADSLGNRRTKA